MGILAVRFVSTYIYNTHVRSTDHNGFIYCIMRGDVLEFNNSEQGGSEGDKYNFQ